MTTDYPTDEFGNAMDRFLDGKPCTLDKLCSAEPAWAANRIRAMEAQLADVEYEAYRISMLESAIWELEQFQKQVIAWQKSGRDVPVKVAVNKIASVLCTAALACRECYEETRRIPGASK